MTKVFNPEIAAFIDRVTEAGSNYRMEETDVLYAEDLGFLVITRGGAVARLLACQRMRC